MKGTGSAPNRYTRTWMRPWMALALVVAIFVALFALTENGRALASSMMQTDSGTPAGIDADALRDFETAVVEALLADDADALETMIAPNFRYANWGGENRIIDRDEVLDLVANILVGPAEAPVYIEELGINEIEAIVGADPLTLWGEDLPVVSVLLLSGLAETGAGEALLAIAPDAVGAPLWVGMLVAEEGLPAAPPPGEASDLDEEAAVSDEETGDEETGNEETTGDDATGADPASAEDIPARTIAAEERIVLESLPAFTTRTASLDGTQANVYLLRAEAGQSVTLDLTASSDTTTLAVSGERNDKALAKRIKQLIAARDAAHADLVEWLDSSKYARFVERLAHFCATSGKAVARFAPQPDEAPPPVQLRHTLPSMIWSRFEAVRAFEPIFEAATEKATEEAPKETPETKAASSAGTGAQAIPVETLHALRIECKYLRYHLEFAAPLLAEEGEALIDALRTLQEELGDLNDAVVGGQLLLDGKQEEKDAHVPSPDRAAEPATEPAETDNVLDQWQALQHMNIERMRSTIPAGFAAFVSRENRERLALALAHL